MLDQLDEIESNQMGTTPPSGSGQDSGLAWVNTIRTERMVVPQAYDAQQHYPKDFALFIAK